MPERVNYNPDILSCLANLSNDEVFTPPEIANAMLDMVPQELFCDPNAKFLDPACKSGVFLREIVKRLNKGLETIIPDREKRMEYIMKKQVFGVSITELTALLSRRSLYCSKDASSRYSIANFKDTGKGGNIRYRRIEHSWVDGKCIYCGASRKAFDRGEDFETHAYEFIHDEKIKEVFEKMKFDLIIGNPPYQMSDGGGNGASAKPIYHLFIQQAKKLNPRFLSMIVPSRWFSGGKGLDSFRVEMLNDSHITHLLDYQDSRDCFPGVDIAGGVCIFLRERDSTSDCEIIHFESGKKDVSVRSLNEFQFLIRDSLTYGIVTKIKNTTHEFMNSIVSVRKPFGIDSNETSDKKGTLLFYNKDGLGKISRSKVLQGFEYLDLYKTIVSKASAEHAGQRDSNGLKKVLSKIELLPPNSCCSETYLIFHSSNTKEQAENAKVYLSSKFVRFLISSIASTQNISRDSFSFVPVQDFSQAWTDQKLYMKYCLSDEEISFIESSIKPIN